jgi:hypothetical protein
MRDKHWIDEKLDGRDKRQSEEPRDKRQNTITKTIVMYKLSIELNPIF